MGPKKNIEMRDSGGDVYTIGHINLHLNQIGISAVCRGANMHFVMDKRGPPRYT